MSSRRKMKPVVKSFQQTLGELKRHVEDLSHSNRFGFQVMFKRLNVAIPISEPPESVYLLCQGVNLPPVGLVTRQMRWDEGPFFSRPQGIDVGGEGLAFEFMLDIDLRAKEFFESWINVIFDVKDATVQFPEIYMHDILIYTLDMQDNPRHVVLLKDAFPRNISMVSYNQSANSTPASITVTFSYHQIETWSLEDMVYDLDPESARGQHLGYRQMESGSFPAPEGFDASKLQSSSRGYVDKAINFFASLNPTVYNIAVNVQQFKVIRV